jgi:hypothetical protein
MSDPEYDKALSAVCKALTSDERDIIVVRFTVSNPRWQGAEVADILDALWEADAHLDITEPFFEANADLTGPAAAIALLAVIRLGRRPSRDTVVALLHRAGLYGPLGWRDTSALADEMRGLAARTGAMADVAADLGSDELCESLAELTADLNAHVGKLAALAAATKP